MPYTHMPRRTLIKTRRIATALSYIGAALLGMGTGGVRSPVWDSAVLVWGIIVLSLFVYHRFNKPDGET